MSEHDGTGEHTHPAERQDSGRQYLSDGVEPGPIPVPLFRLAWRRVSGRQAARDILQVAIGLMVGVLFFAWGVFGSQAVSRQNQDIIKGVRADVLAHAQGSADRQCAIATELEFFFSHPARVNGQRLTFTRPKWQVKELHRLKVEACTLTPLP